ncbi:hypothetical protein MMC18_004886 [Xylographa bjoerkii]|nr:hypothetical protein [Xylographa bjoerkii]
MKEIPEILAPSPPTSAISTTTPAISLETDAGPSRAAVVRLQPSIFIEDPKARVQQAVKMLCSEGTGILRDKLIDEYLEVTSVDNISSAYSLWFSRPRRVCEYSSITESSRFWGDAWPILETEGLDFGAVIPVFYVGSAAQEPFGFEKSVYRPHESPEYWRKHPTFYYRAWHASSGHDFVRIGQAASNDYVALVRIVEATAVACLHTYVNDDYTQLLQHFGVVKSESKVSTSNLAKNWLKIKKNCNNAEELTTLLSKFTDEWSISRGMLALIGYASSKKAAKERWESPLYGKYYLYADVEKVQAVRVKVQCRGDKWTGTGN